MDGCVVGIALREQVPLGPDVQDPEHGFQDGPRRDGFTSRPGIRNVFLRKMFSNAFPLVIAQTEHARTYRDGLTGRQLF